MLDEVRCRKYLKVMCKVREQEIGVQRAVARVRMSKAVV